MTALGWYVNQTNPNNDWTEAENVVEAGWASVTADHGICS